MANIQPKNLQNVQKSVFGQKTQEAKGLAVQPANEDTDLQQQCQVSTVVWVRALEGPGKRHDKVFEVERLPQPMSKNNLRHILT